VVLVEDEEKLPPVIVSEGYNELEN